MRWTCLRFRRASCKGEEKSASLIGRLRSINREPGHKDQVNGLFTSNKERWLKNKAAIHFARSSNLAVLLPHFLSPPPLCLFSWWKFNFFVCDAQKAYYVRKNKTLDGVCVSIFLNVFVKYFFMWASCLFSLCSEANNKLKGINNPNPWDIIF